MRTLICSLVLLGTSFSAQAISTAEFRSADATYLQAVGDASDKNIKQAEAALKQLSAEGAEQSLIQVYMGSLESLKATTVFFPWNKMTHVDLGTEMMEKALDSMDESHDKTMLDGVPVRLRMQLICAHTYSAFPRFLNRFQDAKDLVAEMLESPLLSRTRVEFKNNLYDLAVKIAEEEGDVASQPRELSTLNKG